ncbi:MAG TPA: hypothetical protein CFH79_05050 [Sulfurospirillum sp. UBA11407]|nr:MAG TPA: hypothetical protein CFH79_05050 [Sulfurospirillum sp. UBA11407]
MFRVLCSFFILFLLVLQAEEKSYVFEAKGKFAEELKSLVEKYSKEGKVDVKVYESKDALQKQSKTSTQTILSLFSSNDAEELKYADVEEGKLIYNKQCAECHGINADENRYSTARKLSTLKPLEIVTQLRGYKENYTGQFGGSLRTIMKPHADKLVSEEMQSVAVYIYSIKNGKDMATSPLSSSNNQEENSNEVKSSYLQ